MKRRIRYFSGHEVMRLPNWHAQIRAACAGSRLPVPDPAMLLELATSDQLVAAANSTGGNQVVGFLGLQLLTTQDVHNNWFELGPFWVVQSYRRHEKGGLPVASTLLRMTLDLHRKRMIIGAYCQAVSALSADAGMHRIPMSNLPQEVIAARKQGGEESTILVTSETWTSLEMPDPVGAPSLLLSRRKITPMPWLSTRTHPSHSSE